MNAQMGGNTSSDANGAGSLELIWRRPGIINFFLKQSDINAPAPVNAWVFIDEHPDSINDALFSVDMKPGDNLWKDWPASNRGNSGTLAFADGHAEVHTLDGSQHWQSPRSPHAKPGAIPATTPYTDLPNGSSSEPPGF